MISDKNFIPPDERVDLSVLESPVYFKDQNETKVIDWLNSLRKQATCFLEDEHDDDDDPIIELLC